MIPLGNQRMFAFVDKEQRIQNKLDKKIAKQEAKIEKIETKAAEGKTINEASLAVKNARLAELKAKSIPQEERNKVFIEKYRESVSSQYKTESDRILYGMKDTKLNFERNAFIRQETRKQVKLDKKIAKQEAKIEKMETKAAEGKTINEASLAVKNAKLVELKNKSVPDGQRMQTFIKQYQEIRQNK